MRLHLPDVEPSISNGQPQRTHISFYKLIAFAKYTLDEITEIRNLNNHTCAAPIARSVSSDPFVARKAQPRGFCRPKWLPATHY